MMPPLSEQILQSITVLPEEYQRQVLDFVEFLQTRYHRARNDESEAVSLSFLDVAQEAIGAGEGPGDVSTNSEYMQGYGQ